MPDGEFAKWFLTLGVGGVLAGFIFYFYRLDRKDNEARMSELYGESLQHASMLVGVIRDNTESNTKLVTLLDAMHRRMDGNGGRLVARD